MKIEKGKENLLFSTTNIPDIFFEDYIKDMPSNFVKLYFYIVYTSKTDNKIDISNIAKFLNLVTSEVEDGILYLVEKGLLVKSPSRIIVKNIQESYLNDSYSINIKPSKDSEKKAEQSSANADAIKCIEADFFGGNISRTWVEKIYNWFDKYDFDSTVMLALFQYASDRDALNYNYIDAVAKGWNSDNVKTYSDLENYFHQYETIQKVKKDILKTLNRYSNLTSFEEAYLKTWIMDYNYNIDIIKLAIKQSSAKSNPNFKYFNTILTDWHTNGLKSPDDINTYLNKIKEKNKNIKTLKKTTNYTTGSKRQYDNLDEIYKSLKKKNN